jgi:hypothetical protein
VRTSSGWEGKPIDLAVGDGAHEGRLSGTVLTAETVAVATLETEGSGVEQDLGTISERELAVAKILALLLIIGTSSSSVPSVAERTTHSRATVMRLGGGVRKPR